MHASEGVQSKSKDSPLFGPVLWLSTKFSVVKFITPVYNLVVPIPCCRLEL